MSDYTLSATITGDASKFQKAMQQAQTAMEKVSGKVGSFGSSLQSIGDKMSAAGGKITALETAVAGAAAAIGTQAVRAGASFEAEMAKVSAISGAAGDDLETLTEKAKEMGKKTKFSASESAEAMEYMAMAGWKTGDMLSGIEGIMNLAAASGEDLATTSDIVTDALTAFGLSASDSGEFVDVLAAASSNANTNVSMMGETFKYVAPVAGSLGYSVQDTAVAIGLMANSGIKASQAGTSLRAILSRMAKPTEEVQSAMDTLGVSLTDSSGNMKSFREVMGELRTGFAGLTTDQQAAYASSIGGQEAMSGLLAIVNASDEDFKKLAESIDNSSGACQNMADTMNNTLSGQFTILKSQIEGINIQIFEQMEPVLSDIVGKAQEAAMAISGMISAFVAAKDAGGTMNGIQAAINALSGMANTGGEISDALGSIADKAQLVFDKIQSLQNAGVPLEKIAVSAAALGPALLVGGKAASAFGGSFQGISSMIGGISGVFGDAKGKISSFAGWFSSFSGTLKSAKSPLKEAGTAISGLEGGIKNLAGNGIGKIGDVFSSLAAKVPGVTTPIVVLKAKLQEISGGIGEKVSSVFGKIGDTFGSIGEKLSPVLGKIKDFGSKIGSALSSITKVAGSFGGKFTSILMKCFGFGAIGGLVLVGLGLIQQNFGDEIGEILTMVQQKAPQIITDFCAGITEKIPDLITQGAALVTSLLDTLILLAPSLIDGGINIVLSLVTGFAQALPDLLSRAGEMIVTIVQGLTERLPDILAAGMSVLSALISGISSMLPALIPAAVDMILTLVMGLIDQLPELIDSGLELLTAVVDGIVASLPLIAEKAPEIIEKLATTLIEKAPDLIVTAGELILQLADGLIKAIPTIVAKIPEIIQSIKDKFLDTDWEQLGKDIMNLVLDGLKSIVNIAVDVLNVAIDGINFAFDSEIPHIPYLAHGTDNFAGGFARINEGGRGELVSLPGGTQVIPHDISKQYAKEAARMNTGGYFVEIDYEAIGAAVAAAMCGVDLHTTFQVDGKTIADVTTPYVDQNLGRRAVMSKRYSR
ncbi:phage tail tape measure protein [uncultured Ruminococcus sp.]|uniref:phage tail tape measure protein n=1 Tax=uncultured Ruminococcus sp. TaxID=165186 RepID=UPI00261D7550|nr:phage tail tape measure protein [uncultured Ruminococcus sp.]